MSSQNLNFNSVSTFSVNIKIDELKDQDFIIPINSNQLSVAYSGKFIRQGNTKTEVLFVENTDFIVNRTGLNENTITLKIVGNKYKTGVYIGVLESSEKESDKFFKCNLSLNII